MKNVYDIKKEKGYNYILPLDYSVYGKREYDKVRAVLVILHLDYKETVVQYLEYGFLFPKVDKNLCINCQL